MSSAAAPAFELESPAISVEPRMVIVSHSGEVLAVSNCVLRLEEPAAMYIPRCDVRMSGLRPNGRVIDCPRRGRIRFFDIALASGVTRDAAFEIVEPLGGHGRLAGRLAFEAGVVDHIESMHAGV